MSLCPPAHESTHRREKTGLFCPACPHESPLDGDWIADDSAAGERLLCPRCGTVVVDQPGV
ncbi:hypothetical protein [Haloarcula pelagica]|uniref:hypothetical protein n=1 Tax=Haloarcula pelagica TaxID=3033389 RepID=UPI0024C362F0|nr:hypothetical protein [Halomicroarcula sp. YJ-61-S]